MKTTADFRKRTLVFVGLLVLAVMASTFGEKGFALDTSEYEDWASSKTKPGWYDWGKTYWPTKPVRGGIFRRAASRYVGMMNPNHWPIKDWSQLGLFFGAPLKTGGDYRASGLWLASSWKYLDAVTLEMTFRKGIAFHDGTPLNAHAYKYQFDWVMDKKNGSFWRGMLKQFKSTEVKDEYTLIWHFKEPWAAFMGKMTNTVGWALSEKALKGSKALKQVQRLERQVESAGKRVAKAEKKVEKAAAKGGKGLKKAVSKAKKARRKVAEAEKRLKKAMTLAKGARNFDTHPVGTGPWMFDDASPGNYLKLKRNPNWWFGRSIGLPDMPYFDGVRIDVIPDPSIQLANLRAGKIDRLIIDESQYRLMKRDPNFNVYVNPSPAVRGMSFMHAKGPCRDIRVRKAISHAIDRRALVMGTQFGLARIASALAPGNHWAHNPDLKPVAYDPELSKRLLAEAGYPKGITVKGIAETGDSTLASALKHMLMNVGIDWQVDILDRTAWMERLNDLSYDINVYRTLFYDPDMIARFFYYPGGNFNSGRSHNEKAIRLIEAAGIEPDWRKRQRILHKLEAALYENYEDAWLWWDVDVIAYGRNVQGWNNGMSKKYGTFFSSSHPLWFKDGKR
ncbi:MAG: ABC transporter substrate-binding protein [Proteobacteria bacterium]|nr:ABC transporter substrate-binding protein [Pseudomonadota bacterium]